ncbi:MAG: HTTM domain-containing protein [Myxococcota bacterium]
MRAALLRRAERPLDALGLTAFRVLFGLLTLTSSLRFLAEGWVEQAFVIPTFFFSFMGLEWIQVLPSWAMYGAFIAMALASLCVALGLFYRGAIVAFFLLFTYVELIDVTNYLNHYYLVSLLALLLCLMPLGDAFSLDAWRRGRLSRRTFPAWMTWLLRFQVAVVYTYAAVAKTGSDWLVHGQPMGIWLAARTDIALIGPYLDLPGVALAMSWGGFLYDACVIPLMLWRRTRPFAYLAALIFHGLVGVFFNIGMFPWIMVVSLTVFFEPSWPRRFLNRSSWSPAPRPMASRGWSHAQRLAVVGMTVYVTLQAAVPARAFLYGGDVLWHEQGMRFAWKVMVREKNGSVTYRVRSDRWERERHVYPSRYLTSHQEREMSGQPDQILQLAHHIADEMRADGHREVEVRVDAMASLNGRRMQALIDPNVDLAQIHDGLSRAEWITPAPNDPPILLRPLRNPSTSTASP